MASEAQSKFLATHSSQRLRRSSPSLTAVESFARDESVSRQQLGLLSPVDSRRGLEELPSYACSLLPLCHEYQSSADISNGLQLLARPDVVHAIPTSVATANLTSQSPVTPSPYFPFFTSPAPNSLSGLYYPNPYVMPLAYQQTAAHFPSGWMRL